MVGRRADSGLYYSNTRDMWELPSKVLSPLVFFPISTHFTAPPEIPSAPTVLQLGSFHHMSRVEPWDLTADLKSQLQTLYAQSFRITLAFSVLPRLLEQS
ncbi:hypothetical protein AQUCO_06400051v1 [Aquilegia coerulea]|uniref:Uncharacterized protein n=1 Tax=Aquilegia coerulea TaxID=218851 RepID=A0A2G5CCJ4_AQUCA|nr:hypothetical protein AQUCO_06400051v1 [Aquilegia coerulea]